MGERMNQTWTRTREFFAKLSTRVKILLAVIVLAAIGIIAALVVRAMNRPYAVLFTDLSSDDLASVVSYLGNNGVTDYKIENNNRILVPSAQADRLKMQIMLEGYPSSGFGYTLYLNNIGSLSSDSERRILWQADLQERLAAAIRYIPGVRSAQVFITLGQDSRYILSTDDVIDAEASVIVDMIGSRTLTDQQATAIRNLVSHAVQGLQIDNVQITDSAGNVYAGADSSGSMSATDSASLKLALESRVNSYVQNQISGYLSPLFGDGNYIVRVNSSVDVTRSYEESTLYEQPGWAEQAASGEGIIGRRIWGNGITRDSDGTGAGGVAGTTTNADLNEYVINQAQLNGTESEISTSGEVDYNVSERRRQTEYPVGIITDLNVAIAINSSYLQSQEEQIPINLDEIRHAAALLAGITEEQELAKVSVISRPFYVTPPEPAVPSTVEIAGLTLPGWVAYAAVGGLILFVILIIIILLILRALRKRRERKKAEQEAAEAKAAAEARALEEASTEYEEYLEDIPEGEEPLPDEEIVITSDGRRQRRRRRKVVRVGQGNGPEDERDALLDAASQAGAALEGADIMDIHTEAGMALRKDIRKFVEDNPSIAAQMLKNWLRGNDEENGGAASG